MVLPGGFSVSPLFMPTTWIVAPFFIMPLCLLSAFILSGVEIPVNYIFLDLLNLVEFLHVKPGKGAAFVRTKMRNYITGNTVEKTFRAGSTVNSNLYSTAIFVSI